MDIYLERRGALRTRCMSGTLFPHAQLPSLSLPPRRTSGAHSPTTRRKTTRETGGLHLARSTESLPLHRSSSVSRSADTHAVGIPLTPLLVGQSSGSGQGMVGQSSGSGAGVGGPSSGAGVGALSRPLGEQGAEAQESKFSFVDIDLANENQPSATQSDSWQQLDTAITDSHGRIYYTIPTDKICCLGIHKIRMLVRFFSFFILLTRHPLLSRRVIS